MTSLSAPTKPGWGVRIYRIALAALLIAVVAEGIIFNSLWQFSTFAFWDDEGRLLLETQHMLQGKALYDQINCIYGPFYFFERWVIFGLFNVPLGNDTFRFVTLAPWSLTALVLALTASRLARPAGLSAGLAAIVWLASIYYLRVGADVPGHPQGLDALLLAVSLWLCVEMRDRWKKVTLVLLGAIAAALLLTKVNVGVFFCLALAFALLSLAPRPPLSWTILQAMTSLGILALPVMLMRSRFDEGHSTLCFVVVAALAPCCLIALSTKKQGTLRIESLLLCGLGVAVLSGLVLAFAHWQGNTTAGMIKALITRPAHVLAFSRSHYGKPLMLPLAVIVWSLLSAAAGIVARWRAPRVFLDPLRLLACGTILWGLQAPHMYDDPRLFYALPLCWLILVPPAKRELREQEWFFRLFLAFNACLQPLQIYPIAGSQIQFGTFVMILAAVVLLLDLLQARIGTSDARFAPLILRAVMSLLILTPAVLLVGPLVHRTPVPVLSLTRVWPLLGAGLGLAALWSGPEARRFLWPLRLIACLIITGEVLASGPWDTGWIRLVLPLIWLVMVPPSGLELHSESVSFRLVLTLIASVQPLQFVLMIDGRAPLDTVAMLDTLVMLLALVVLLLDLHSEVCRLEVPRVGATLFRLIMSLAILLPPATLIWSRLPSHQGVNAVVDAIVFALALGWAFVLICARPAGTGLIRRLLRRLSASAALLVMIVFVLWRSDSLEALLDDLIARRKVTLQPVGTIFWPLLCAGLGLCAVWFAPAGRRRLWLLRLFFCAVVFGPGLVSGLRDTTWTRYTLPLAWLLLVPPGRESQRDFGELSRAVAGQTVAGTLRAPSIGQTDEPQKSRSIDLGLRGSPGNPGWVVRLFLTMAAFPESIGMISIAGAEIPLAAFVTVAASVVLLFDLCQEAGFSFGPHRSLFAIELNMVLASLALVVGSRLTQNVAERYARLVPVQLPGCRWTRMSEREASLYTFLAENVHASSDCVLAWTGLASLHFWADQAPASNVVIPNSLETLDAVADEALLSAHRDRERMMFIDNPNPIQISTSKLKIQDFVTTHFKQLARVGVHRLLVRNDRKDLDLYACAFEAESGRDAGQKPLLHLRVPQNGEMTGAAKIQLVDLGTGLQVASTAARTQRLVLMDRAGRELLPTVAHAPLPDLSGVDGRLVLAYPEEIRLRDLEFPAVRFQDTQGRRLLTLPVAVETAVRVAGE